MQSACFVALSRFAVANGMTGEVKKAFRSRPHLVEEAEGFVRLDVISPVDAPNELWLITYWRDEECFRKWHHSPRHKESHRGMPRGLKLDPAATEIRYFEHVCE